MTEVGSRTAEVRRVLAIVLWLNLAVVALKVVALISSHALSVAAETVNSSLDAINNVFALWIADRKSTRLNSSHVKRSRMPSSA